MTFAPTITRSPRKKAKTASQLEGEENDNADDAPSTSAVAANTDETTAEEDLTIEEKRILAQDSADTGMFPLRIQFFPWLTSFYFHSHSWHEIVCSVAP